MPRRSPPSPTDRTYDDNWHGSYYELAIKLGPADDSRLDTALKALWDVAHLDEPFRRDGSEGADVSVTALLEGHLNGIANIPGLGATLASVVVVREESYDTGQTIFGNDWLDLCLPLGALGNLDKRVGAYPFDDGSDSKGVASADRELVRGDRVGRLRGSPFRPRDHGRGGIRNRAVRADEWTRRRVPARCGRKLGDRTRQGLVLVIAATDYLGRSPATSRARCTRAL